MKVNICKFELRIAYAHSLKEKRSVIKKIIMKVRNKFNVSIAEVEHQDLWQRATLGFAMVGSSDMNTTAVMDNIIKYIEENFEIEAIELSNELITL